VYPGQILHRIKPYEVNVFVAIVEEYGASNQKEQESHHAPWPPIYLSPPPP